MTSPLQFAFTAEQMANFLAWRSQVEAETGAPLEGVVFSFLVTRQGNWQILVRSSTDQDFKLKGIARSDGTYDTFAPYEEVFAEYDNFGFASTPLDWPDVGLRLHLCYGPLLERSETPRCYVECLNDPHQPLLPFRVSEQPDLLEADVLLHVLPYTPLPPALHQRVQQFIRTNVTALLQHWHGEDDNFDVLDALQPPGSDDTSEEHPRQAEA